MPQNQKGNQKPSNMGQTKDPASQIPGPQPKPQGK